MKLLLCTLLIGVMLLGVASATSDCRAAASLPTNEYTKCQLMKPVETVVGDVVTINCTTYTNEGNVWVTSPLSSTTVFITGYDGDLEPIDYMALQMDKGTYSFIPSVVGSYVVRVGNEYSASFVVGENPILDGGFITGGVVAAETPSEESSQVINFTETESQPAEEKPTPTIASFLSSVVNKEDNEQAKEEAPSLMLMLVSFLIA